MITTSMPDHRLSQKMYPLSLFVRLVSNQLTGCLQVTSGFTSWSIYLEAGQLTFATNTDRPLERLQRHLQQLSLQVTTLTNTVCTQACQRSTTETANQLTVLPDYQAIQWLVDQAYLNLDQVSSLIEELAKEVIEPFLSVSEGSYEFISQEVVGGNSGFCRIELRPLVEHCQMQLRRKQSLTQTVSTPATSTALLQPELQESSTVDLPNQTLGTISQAIKKEVYTIACVDDSTTILEAINSFLGEANFSVVMINDPLKAVMQVVRTKPDIVLMDVGMPNLDGYELCSLLRRHSNFKSIPIIMVTGHTGFIDRAKAKLVGASGYLTKPFTRSELLKMVFKHLA
jgi:chemotaxis family two-component system response regulator PixG